MTDQSWEELLDCPTCGQQRYLETIVYGGMDLLYLVCDTDQAIELYQTGSTIVIGGNGGYERVVPDERRERELSDENAALMEKLGSYARVGAGSADAH